MNMNHLLATVTIILVLAGALCLLGMALQMWMRHRARTLGWNHGANGEEGQGFESGPNFLSYTIGYQEGLAARAEATVRQREAKREA